MISTVSTTLNPITKTLSFVWRHWLFTLVIITIFVWFIVYLLKRYKPTWMEKCSHSVQQNRSIQSLKNYSGKNNTTAMETTNKTENKAASTSSTSALETTENEKKNT